jgi:D-alanyl-D-alanine carboxypeptidase
MNGRQCPNWVSQFSCDTTTVEETVLSIKLSSSILVGFMFAASVCAQTPAAVPTPSATPAPVASPTPPPPTLNAKSWVLMDYATGQILLDGNADMRVEPASITKIMTSYVVSAELAHGKIHMEDKVKISENAWRSGGAGTDGSTSFLELNSEVPLRELLYGMIIQSGNDAAIALAEHTAGSESLFADLMNQYAAQLGMSNTHYVDASGLPNENHYTTARDIAVLSRALIRDFPAEYDIYKVKQFEWNGITPAQPQYLALARFNGGWHQDRPHQFRRLLPGHLGQARRPATDCGGHGIGKRKGARRCQSGIAQLWIPLL